MDTESLWSVSLAFASGRSLATVCGQLLDRLCHLVAADSGVVFLTQTDDWLRPVASRGMPEGLVEHLESAAAWATRSRRPVRLGEVPVETTAGNLRVMDVGDCVSIPVSLDEHVLGAFVLVRTAPTAAFDDRDLVLCVALANELALSVERAHVQAQLGEEQVRTNLTQRQLEAYAEDFRLTFDGEKEKTAQLAGALAQLESTYLSTVRSLAIAVEAKDEYTGGHISRVTHYGMAILGRIDPGLARDKDFKFGFLLHDVGKLAVPDAILTKKGPLTDEEWEIMRAHPHVGRRILGEIPFLGGAQDIVLSHHERWDGYGYPNGLAGEQIPLGARIFAVADSFDAMTTDRPYRSRLSYEAARAQLRANAGSQFWPEAVEAFLSVPVDRLNITADPLSFSDYAR
ncbi:MAG TPA: HD domain-containing phosphohydrolase [Actinomycetota bacterium]|nr:HD domain-containing phosphohydrolase [Actinomycetota bacterium]